LTIKRKTKKSWRVSYKREIPEMSISSVIAQILATEPVETKRGNNKPFTAKMKKARKSRNKMQKASRKKNR
jgi:hypothetical protein